VRPIARLSAVFLPLLLFFWSLSPLRPDTQSAADFDCPARFSFYHFELLIALVLPDELYIS